jgi:hypothetical protein
LNIKIYSFRSGSNLLQKFINTNSIMRLRKYYDIVRESLSDIDVKLRAETLMSKLETSRVLIEDSRPVELLHITSELTRLLNGIRVTNCKSGKDRTGVSVSLEQCFILVREHHFDNSLMQYTLNDLRR